MTTDELTDGMVVKLSHDVQNPHPDRRKKYDFEALPVWKAGLTFTVRVYPEQDRGSYTLPRDVVLEPLLKGHIYGTISSGHGSRDQLTCILEAAEPADETLDAVLENAGAKGWGYEEALKILLKQGKITLDDVRAAIAAVEDD